MANNSFTRRGGRSQYACGTPRAYIGNIMRELHQGLVAQVGKQRALTWWQDVGRKL